MERSVSIDMVLSAFSHEARTPLAALRGALALLMDGSAGELNEDARGLIDLGVRNIRRLESLLVSVLDSGRVARGEWPVDPIPARLERLARAAVDEALDGGGRARARVELDFPEHLPLVPADPEGMRRVIKNLVANALRFTPPSGHVIVSGYEADGEVVVRVADSGPGVGEADREWIFGRFQQGREDNGKKGGMGLGLFLSHQITRAHGGTLACIAPPPDVSGACFELRLPIRPADPAMPETRSLIPVVRVRRRDGAPLTSGQVFSVSEALRSSIPSARRWESPNEVQAMLVPGPIEELEAAAAVVAGRLDERFQVDLSLKRSSACESRVA